MRYMHHTNRYPGNQIFVNYRVVIEEILPKVQLHENKTKTMIDNFGVGVDLPEKLGIGKLHQL